MKATVELDDALYRRLKSEAALRGTTVREMVTTGVRMVLGEQPPVRDEPEPRDAAWFGSLRRDAGNAQGRHDLASIRQSIADGRPGVRR
jgi:hypothetical protein